DVANHGRQPVFFFQSISRADRNRFLPQARIESADNLVLAEELYHGVFHRAVQPHVVVQVQVLLPRQIFLHPLLQIPMLKGPRAARRVPVSPATLPATRASSPNQTLPRNVSPGAR